MRQPKTVAAAEKLCARYAEIEGFIALCAELRDTAIAEANSIADEAIAPLLEEQRKIAAKLEPFWNEKGHELTEGKRKTVELGGCIIGTKEGRPAIVVEGKQADVANALRSDPDLTQFVKTTHAPDKPALKKGLLGSLATKLIAIGISMSEPQDEFVLKRAEQGRTIGRS